MYSASSVLPDAIKKKKLTHLGQMEFPTLINWTSLFQGLWVVGWYFLFYSNFNRTFSKQTVELQIRCGVLRRQSWVCTV